MHYLVSNFKDTDGTTVVSILITKSNKPLEDFRYFFGAWITLGVRSVTADVLIDKYCDYLPAKVYSVLVDRHEPSHFEYHSQFQYIE